MPATLISKEYVSGSMLKKYKFTIPTIPLSSDSGEVALALDQPKGQLEGVHVVGPTSTSFNISIRTKTGVTTPCSEEIYYRDGMNLFINEIGILRLFKNEDTVQVNALYIKITNADSGNATGVVEINLWIREV